MPDVADRYARLADAFAATVDGVPAGQWDAPSPCEGWTALDVVAHVVDTHGIFERLVGRELGEVPPVGDDPAGAFAAARTVVERDLRDPDAAGASYDGLFGRSTFAEGVDQFLCGDLLVHRWDLARATGQDETMPEDEVQRFLEILPSFGDALRGPNTFGPEIPAPPDADAQTRLLCFLGRRP
jgi:uncharacterized protein (TIGR03086 family)